MIKDGSHGTRGKAAPYQVRNVRLLRFGRLLLLAISWPLGLYLLLGGVEPFFGLFLLLAGIWLLLDNPLESFAVLSGPCPACGAEVGSTGRRPCRCPSCGAAITVGEGCFSLAETERGVSDRLPEELTGVGNEAPFPKPLHLAAGDTLDLHTFSPREVAPLLDDFLHLCEQAGITRARIIHGKGMGVVRRRVRILLSRDSRVVSFSDAPAQSGGWGATVVELRFGAQADVKEPA